MADFDPDAYLKGGAGAFDPDAYLAGKGGASLPAIGADVAKSAGIGLAHTGVSAAGLPGDIGALATHAFDWSGKGQDSNKKPLPEQGKITQQYPPVGPADIREELGKYKTPMSMPTSSDIQKGIEKHTGPFYKPKTPFGELAKTTAEFAPGMAVGPGGLLRRAVTQVAIPAIASEAAVQLPPVVHLPEVKGTPAEPWVRMGAAVAPGLLGPAAVGAVSKIARPLTKSGRELLAGQVLERRATNPGEVRNALETAERELVPGSHPTTFQLTGDIGLGALEREVATTDPARFMQHRAGQNQARLDQLEKLQTTGNPQEIPLLIQSRLATIEQDTQRAVEQATAQAQQRAAAIGGNNAQEVVGAELRTALQTAENNARAQERRLWNAVDPNGDLTVNMAPVTSAAKDIYGDLSHAATASLKPEEQTILGIISNYKGVESFQELKDLRSLVSEKMREELGTAGRSQTYRRLTMLRQDIEGVINNAIVDRSLADAANVAAGKLAPEQSLVSRIQQQVQEWKAERAGRDQSALRIGETAEAGPSVLPPASRGAGEAGPGSRNVAGDQGVQGDADLFANFDKAAADRLKAASAATLQRAQTFNVDPLKGILKREQQSGPYKTLPSAVPEKIFKPGPTGFETVNQYRNAVGDQVALPILSEHVAGSVRRAAMNPDGTLNPARFEQWRNRHSEALRAFPQLEQQFTTAAQATERIADAAAARRVALDQFQTGTLSKFLNIRDPQDVTRAVGSIFGSKNAMGDMRAIYEGIKHDPAAVEGLQKAIADHIVRKFISNTEAATSGRPLMRADQFQSFIKDNEKVLSIVLPKEKVQSLKAVADDLQRANRSIVAVKIPGQSNTAQDLTALTGHSSQNSILTQLLIDLAAAGAAGVLSKSEALTLGGGLVAQAVNYARNAGFKKVDDLVKVAMLPTNDAERELAKALLQKAYNHKMASNNLARKFAAVGTTAALAAEQERGRNRGGRVSPFGDGGVVKSFDEQNASGALLPTHDIERPANLPNAKALGLGALKAAEYGVWAARPSLGPALWAPSIVGTAAMHAAPMKERREGRPLNRAPGGPVGSRLETLPTGEQFYVPDDEAIPTANQPQFPVQQPSQQELQDYTRSLPNQIEQKPGFEHTYRPGWDAQLAEEQYNKDHPWEFSPVGKEIVANTERLANDWANRSHTFAKKQEASVPQRTIDFTQSLLNQHLDPNYQKDTLIPPQPIPGQPTPFAQRMIRESWPMQMLGSGMMLPGDVASGKLPTTAFDPASGQFMTNPEVIHRAQDLAGLMGGTSIEGTPKGALGTTGSKALSDTQKPALATAALKEKPAFKAELAPVPQLPAVYEPVIKAKPELAPDIGSFLKLSEIFEKRHGPDWATKLSPAELDIIKSNPQLIDSIGKIDAAKKEGVFDKILSTPVDRRNFLVGASKAISVVGNVSKLAQTFEKAVPNVAAQFAPISKDLMTLFKTADKKKFEVLPEDIVEHLTEAGVAPAQFKDFAKSFLKDVEESNGWKPKDKETFEEQVDRAVDPEKWKKIDDARWDELRDLSVSPAEAFNRIIENRILDSGDRFSDAPPKLDAQAAFEDLIEMGYTKKHVKILLEELEKVKDEDEYMELGYKGLKGGIRKLSKVGDDYPALREQAEEAADRITRPAQEKFESIAEPARKKYELATKSQKEEYNRIEKEEFQRNGRVSEEFQHENYKKFNQATKQAREELDRVLDPARDEYNKALDRANKEYERILGPHYKLFSDSGKTGAPLAALAKNEPKTALAPYKPAELGNDIQNFVKLSQQYEGKYGNDWVTKLNPQELQTLKSEPAISKALENIQAARNAGALDKVLGAPTTRREVFGKAAGLASYISNANQLGKMLEAVKPPPIDLAPVYQKIGGMQETFKSLGDKVMSEYYTKERELRDAKAAEMRSAIERNNKSEGLKTPYTVQNQPDGSARVVDALGNEQGRYFGPPTAQRVAYDLNHGARYAPEVQAIHDKYDPAINAANEEMRQNYRKLEEDFGKEIAATKAQLNLPKLDEKQQKVLDYIVHPGWGMDRFQDSSIRQNPYDLNLERMAGYIKQAKQFGHGEEDVARLYSDNPAYLLLKMTPAQKAEIAEHIKPALLQDRNLRLEDIRTIVKAFPSLKGFQLFADPGKVGAPLAALAHEGAKPAFYSVVERAVQDAKQQKMPINQWVGWLKNQPGVKKEEIEHLKLENNPDLKGVVTKQQMLDHIENNGVKLNEVWKTGDAYHEEAIRQAAQDEFDRWMEDANSDRYSRPPDQETIDKAWDEILQDVRAQPEHYRVNSGVGGSPKYSDQQLPGGENYRELLLTLPEKPYRKNGTYDIDPNFRSSHWPDDPNPIVHARVNDRMIAGPDGKPRKTLFAEEIQSDVHQSGRKQGYQNFRERTPEEGQEFKALQYKRNEQEYTRLTPEEESRYQNLYQIGHQGIQKDLVPNLPFKQSWPDLMLKRLIREAAEKGYDQIAWTPGEVQNERYNLAKNVDQIDYRPSDGYNRITNKRGNSIHSSMDDKPLTPKELSDYIGKEATERLLSQKPNMDGIHTLKGADLKVGGEGMLKFYDDMLVNKANDIGKKFGAKVGQGALKQQSYQGLHIRREPGAGVAEWVVYDHNFPGEIVGSADTKAGAQTMLEAAKREMEGGGNQVHVLPITPQLKKAAMEGFQLFSDTGKVGAPLAAVAKGDRIVDPNFLYYRAFNEVPRRSDETVDAHERRVETKRQELLKDINKVPTIETGPLGGLPGARAAFQEHIGNYIPEKDFQRDFFAGMHSPKTKMDWLGKNTLHFEGPLEHGGNRIGEMSRSIDFKNGIAHHGYLEINHGQQGSGIAKKLLANQVEAYQKLGLNRVETYANFDVGSYAWAKYGFVPATHDEWITVAGKAQNRLNDLLKMGKVNKEDHQILSKILTNWDPKSIWDVSDYAGTTKTGEPIAKKLLINNSWNATLELYDQPSMDRFYRYVKKGAK